MAEDNKIQYNLKDFENDLEENMENSDEQNYDLTNESNSFDAEKALDVTVHTADVLSKILAYLGVLAVLSYPIIRILNVLFGMDKFMALLPLGYTNTSIPGTGDISGFMAFFALFCLYNGVRMGIWVAKSPYMATRIICIVIGVLFMVSMVSKEANDILLGCILLLTGFVILAAFIPILLLFVRKPFPREFYASYYIKLFKIVFLTK